MKNKYQEKFGYPVERTSHCPRALKFSSLWDVDEITKNVAQPPAPRSMNSPGQRATLRVLTEKRSLE